MKTSLRIRSVRFRRNQSGVAVIIMLALLSLILIYIMANVRSLNSLQKELQQTEQRQLRHWNAIRSQNLPITPTNSIPPTNKSISTLPPL